MPYTAAEKAEHYQSVHDKLASAVVKLQDIAKDSEPESEETQSAQSLAGQLTNMVGDLSVKIMRQKQMITPTAPSNLTGPSGASD